MWPWPLVITDALPVGFKSGLHEKASHRRGLGGVQDSRKELRERPGPFIGGGQFLMSNRSFTKGRFKRRRRNVEKEVGMYCGLIPGQDTRHCIHIVHFIFIGTLQGSSFHPCRTDKVTEVQRST